MPTSRIIHMLSKGNIHEKLLLQVAIQCAPMLKGLKEASIILLSREMVRMLFRLLRNTDINVKILYHREKKLVLYLYREEQLAGHLGKREVKDALACFGYKEGKLEELLEQLSASTRRAYESHGTCPHEIGLFLGYPVGDVMGFVKHGGSDYLMSGYWKVYENVHRAQEIFNKYTSAKESAVREVFKGYTLRQIAQVG